MRLESFVQGFEAATRRPTLSTASYSDQESLFELWRLIDHHFNESELRTLAFALAVEYESLGQGGKSDRVRELIGHMERQGKLRLLLDWCMEMRPNVVWKR